MWQMHSITNVLSDHLGWHRARLKFMARFTVALLQRTTTDLWDLAVALKGNVKDASNHRRIQRFLSDYDVDFAMLGRLIAHLVPESPLYEVVVDRTEWEFGDTSVNILSVGIAHNTMAFPVAWAALSSEGGASTGDQIRALEQFLRVVDPESIKVLTADREFISARWLKRLKEEGIPFVVRLRADRKVADAPGRGAISAQMYSALQSWRRTRSKQAALPLRRRRRSHNWGAHRHSARRRRGHRRSVFDSGLLGHRSREGMRAALDVKEHRNGLPMCHRHCSAQIERIRSGGNQRDQTGSH